VAVLDILQRALEPLPLHGKGRLAEQILRRSKTESLKCHPLGGLEIHLRRSQRIERLMWAGAYERELIAFLKTIVRPSMTVFDVGANIGYLAAIVAQLSGPQGQVHAFEPNPECNARLKLNLSPFPHAHAHRLAISDHAGTLPLYLSEDPEEDGWGSLLRRAGMVRQIMEVAVTTIDEFVFASGVRRLDLIKIDIEGGEMRALRGARQLIERDHPGIIAELNAVCLARDGAKPGDVIGFLTSLGYSIRDLDGSNIYAVR
jgi:FkbM family methyltransferase